MCIILGVALGVAATSGNTPNTMTDVDEIYIRSMVTYTGEDADNLFFAIRGDNFNDVGNIYDRSTKQIFDVGDIEVSKLAYTVKISDENALIYILRANMTDPEKFVILDQINNFGEITGEIGIGPDHDILIVVFYYGVKLVSIEGFLYSG